MGGAGAMGSPVLLYMLFSGTACGLEWYARMVAKLLLELWIMRGMESDR